MESTRAIATAEQRQLAAWRRRKLRAAGVPDRLARRLARDWTMDLHALIELLERGCPPELAVRILAPLDDPTAP
jgi:hypothetical protein